MQGKTLGLPVPEQVGLQISDSNVRAMEVRKVAASRRRAFFPARTSLAALLLGALLAPTGTNAQNSLGIPSNGSQPPITINSCGPSIVKPSPFATATPNPFQQLFQPATSTGMHIVFTNESDKVADLVNFEVRSNGVQFVIRDVGTFSPGISIDHSYRNGAGQAFILPAFIPPDVTCRVASVRFTDQSVWPSPASIAPRGRRSRSELTANPSTVIVPGGADSVLVMISSADPVAGISESDNCGGIAAVFVSATAQTSAVYSIKPIGSGSCTASFVDEAGRKIDVPINVQ
jgi:hypothetical protein